MPRQQFIFTKPVRGEGVFFLSQLQRDLDHIIPCAHSETPRVWFLLFDYLFLSLECPVLPPAPLCLERGALCPWWWWLSSLRLLSISQSCGSGSWTCETHVLERWLWASCRRLPQYFACLFFYRQRQGPILQAGFVCLGQMCGYFWWLVWHPPSTMLP